MDLTFGEQILLLLKRKNMTIPEYARLLEERTGIPCSSQYLNQQLKKDNFLEQDMSILAAALDRRVVISLEPLSSGHDSEDFSMFTGHRTAQREIQIQAEVQSQIEQQNIPAPERPGETSRTEEPQARPAEQMAEGSASQAASMTQTVDGNASQARTAELVAEESAPPTGTTAQTVERNTSHTRAAEQTAEGSTPHAEAVKQTTVEHGPQTGTAAQTVDGNTSHTRTAGQMAEGSTPQAEAVKQTAVESGPQAGTAAQTAEGNASRTRTAELTAEESAPLTGATAQTADGNTSHTRTAGQMAEGSTPQAETVKQTAVENSSQAEMAAKMSRESTPQTGRAGQTPEGSAASTAPLSDQDMMIRQITQGLLAAVQHKSGNSSGKSARPSPSLSPDSINPYTNEEYLNNTVRKHPDQERFIQVYDITEHKWIDVPENYFQKFQAVKRRIMGRDYTPPIYI